MGADNKKKKEKTQPAVVDRIVKAYNMISQGINP